MTKKIIEYGFMGDEEGITYVINHKPNLEINKYKFFKVIEKVESKKIEQVIQKQDDIKQVIDKKEIPKQIIDKKEIPKQVIDKKEDINQVIPKQDDINLIEQNNNLYLSIILFFIFILIIYYFIPKYQPQLFGFNKK